MGDRWPARLLISVALVAATPAIATPDDSARSPRVDESFFADAVYPALHAVQCERCHSDNGVASETRLEFPEPDAGRDRITAFGLALMDLVDRHGPRAIVVAAEADEAREAHRRPADQAGRRRGEAVLLGWINYLAGLSDEQVRQARERIARSERRGLEALTVRRLTHSQYDHTVRDLLGDQTQPAGGFPKEDFVNGFKNQRGGSGGLAAPGGSLQPGGRAARPRPPSGAATSTD